MEAFDIDWSSSKSYILINPSYPEKDRVLYRSLLSSATDYSGHIWLSTSGSQSHKWVGLSHEALLASAKAVNTHLEAKKSDKWIQVLPKFHVGGIGVTARAFLAGSEVYDFREKMEGRWCAQSFVNYIEETKGTLTALVPTQLYDIISIKKRSPNSLRAVIIGGGALPYSLYQQAIDLGWPVMPSYGMTECCSQIATAEKGCKDLKILSHVKIKIIDDLIALESPSLLTVYAVFKDRWEFIDPKINGLFVSEDRGEIDKNTLRVLGRKDQIIKIGGERVDLSKLEDLFQSIKITLSIGDEAILIDMDDQRLGKAIHLVVSGLSHSNAEKLSHQYNQAVMPYEKIRKIHTINAIPKSPLMKVLKSELRRKLGQS